MRHLAAICAFLAFMNSAELSRAQMSTPLHVGPFGGSQEPLPQLAIPPELKYFVPAGFLLRAVLPAKMSSAGETLFLYDNGEEVFPEVHLHAIREGKPYQLFDGVISGIAGLVCLPSNAACRFASFAYHRGGDLADTTFVVFGFEQGSYRSLVQQDTAQGKMRVLSGSPLRFELWAANLGLDPPDPDKSCEWCPHRYTIRIFQQEGSTFKVVSERTTKKFLNPGDIAAQAFVTPAEKN